MSDKSALSDKLIVCGVIALAMLSVWMVVREMSAGNTPPIQRDNSQREIDERLIHYKELKHAKVSLKELLGISVTKDFVYVCGDGGVRVLTHKGKEVVAWMKDRKIESIAALNKDVIYIASGTTVEKINSSGKVLQRWKDFTSTGWIRSLEVNDDHVFVAMVGEVPPQSRSGSVFICNHDGEIIRQIGNEHIGQKIKVPGPHIDVHWSSSENVLYVSNPGYHRIDRFDLEGKLLGSIGKLSFGNDGFCGCCNPICFDVAGDGTYITAEKGIARIKRLFVDGTFNDIVAAPKSFHKNVRIWDLELHEKNVYVLDNERKQLRIFTHKA
ncbi:MAG: hypothetical protein HRU15_10515 [Planctomycetes bacterium]|nr:hypothetical protein [Planctomycetota bacterium]